ncbi:3'-5' exonuclease [Candidatus Oscillochloris fontis]|uniref:3'-5' exonuclease n=1 Tax=Candidatus Oscillochloris fontis TaxID=2496868 RepID=UPI001375FD93|nr:3'-5' exonuclease [Candidatus Oscillochloris fontis]
MAEEQEAFNKLLTLTEPKKRFADFSVRMFSEQNSSSSHLNLITLHGAKGTEFDSVVLMGIDRGVLPRRNVNQRDQKESRRLFYVGITRAKSEIHIVCASEGENTRGHLVGPSPLVLELQRRLGK